MPSKSRRQLRIALSFAGIFALLATVALGAATVRPTEATWQDTVHGESQFKMANPYEDNSFARAVSTYGFMDRATRDDPVDGTTAFRQTPNTSLDDPRSARHRSSVGIGILRLVTVGKSCATLDMSQLCANAVTDGVINPSAIAVSETHELDVNASTGIDLVSYDDVGAPLRATVACSPTQSSATLTEGKAIELGRAALFDDPVFLPVPEKNDVTTRTRDWGAYDYVAKLHHIHEAKPGYAVSQLRLRVDATGTAGNERWNLNLILAHAECGVDRATTPTPERPSNSDIWPASALTMARMAAPAEVPTALQSTTDLADEERAEGNEVEKETGDKVEARGAAEAVAEPNTDEDAAELPPLTGLKTATKGEPSEDAAGEGLDGVETSEAATTPPAKSVAAPPAPPTSAPATTKSSGTEPTTSEPTTPNTVDPTKSTTAPQAPQDVSVSRWFSITGPGGAELGRAKLEDVTRTADCGAELTLSITTSDKAGPDRWSSIGPEDFAEVRPGGNTRDAQPVNSDCEQAPDSGPTALSPDSDYEIVIAFHLSDSASRAMLRPEGTAGWIFDLPTPTTTSAATTTPTTTAAATTTTTAEA